MLTYQPQNDVYNGIFRILSLLMYDTTREYHIDLLRILDFYYIFPNFICDIKFPSNLIKDKAIFKKYSDNLYFIKGQKKQIFYTLTKVQDSSLNILFSKNILDCSLYKKEIIKLNANIDFAPFLYEQIMYRNTENKDIIDFLINKLSKIDFLGENGLKARTGLMEYKYDSF